MKQYNNVQKISTGIHGLDDILLGGLQLPMNTFDKKEPGIVITIKGCKGTDKTMFAMQIMHGITKSLRHYNGPDTLFPPIFYSMDKTYIKLNDMLLDLVISQCIRKIIKLKQDSRKVFPYNNSLFADIIFDTNQKVYVGTEQDENTPQLPDDICTHLDRYIAEGIVFYNIRTNSLHFRTKLSKDTQANMLFVRRHNLIHEYLDKITRFSDDYDKIDDFQNDFFEVQFNAVENKNDRDNFVYKLTPANKFTQIASEIQDRYSTSVDTKDMKKVPCTVIDDISQIGKQELDGSLSSIERLLRETSLVSIIVVDDVEEDMFHSDISIEMRRVDDKNVNYSNYYLSINKSVFQMTAYGWHQYKKRDHGIEVYPSSHLSLHPKRYLPQSIINTKNGILDWNYLQYLDFSKECDEKKQYYDYEKERSANEYNRLRELYVNRFYKNISNGDDLLGYLLTQEDTVPNGKTVAIIGYPNTFKRFLAVGSSFCAAKNGYHTLFLTFDRLSSNLLQQMQCPALVCKEKELPCVSVDENITDGKKIQYKNTGNGNCSPLCPYSCRLKDCKRCYDHLHAFNINMGCISSDELLHYLAEQLDIYFDKAGNSIKRIIFDDLQKVDFCFPLLKNNGLFFPALKSFCQKRGIDLIILCDKKAGLVNELVSLSENVICMHREKNNDLNKVTFLIEKFAGNIYPSQVFKIETNNIYELFHCDTSFCRINPDKDIMSVKIINSMSDYWNDKDC